MSNRKRGTGALLAIALLLLLSGSAFGQAAASLSGSVTDTSQAVLPGSNITAINTQTGVETNTVANSAGIYSFPSLQPGVYNVVAKIDGFQTATKTDVKLGMASQIRLNFELVVAGTSTEVEVTSSAENLVLDSGSSTGTVLQEEVVTELPLVSNDVMDLINIMGGVIKSEDPIFSNYQQTFAGVSSGNINVARDGISVSEVRWASGIVSPSRVNQEMVGEFKMILSPVDAEMGRGAGQVQIMTKSGANAFHGAGIWNIQNTALDAEEWYLKRNNDRSPWRNLHNYTVSVSGPIIKNRTFFFATWDQQMVRERTQVRVSALTDCARLGIYRYFGGWTSLNALNYASFQPPDPDNPYAVPARPVVNLNGTPAYTYTDQESGYSVTQAPEDLKFGSVMGELSPAAYDAIAADPIGCSVYEQSGLALTDATFTTPWSREGVRDRFDESGYIAQFTGMVPRANVFDTGDGLNTAGYRWTRTTKGANNVYGTGQDSERKSITIKLDHNISSAHRVSGTYNIDNNVGEDSMPSWDNEYSFGGNITRRPQSFTASLTSTLRPTLLNEFRFGLSRTLAEIADPMVADREGLTAVLHQLMPTSEEYPVVIEYDSLGFSPGYNFFNMFGGSGVSHPYGSMGVQGGSWGGKDHRWTVSDTMTWMRGAHSFKGGVEVRLSKSLQESNSQAGSLVATSMYPAVLGGAMSTSSYDNTEFDSWTADGLTQGNSGTLTNLLSWYAGSVQEIQQYFYTASAENRTWNDLLAGERLQVTDLRNREFAFFFKDDWKVNSSLTLNLGVRYEYYGVPWEESGMSVALVGGSQSLWGPYGGDFDTWMPADPSALTYGGDDRRAAYQFVGPNSPNSDLSPWNKDTNNFAPHVGFSWQLPWLGKGKTTLRGGYSISYSPIANFDGFGTVMSRVPGTEYRYTYGSTPDYPYLNLNDIKNAQATGLLPLAPPASIQPLSVRSLYERSQSLSVYDDDIQNPYVQNLNLSLTRQIGNAFTVDVRYIGTLSRKQLGGINLNAPNFVSNGLAQEFDLIRAGEQSEVINSLIPSGALWYGPPGATGSDQVRTYDIFFSNMHIGTAWDLMQGNYSSLANQLATANGIAGAESGVAGALLRGGLWNGEQTPENLIYASPQFSSATLNSNLAHSNYHSLQAQVTMRPLRGLSFQNTYTWSRNLTDQGMTDYLSGNRRYYLASQHRSHTLNSYGSFDLPMGANGFLFRDASGAFKKAIEGWQLSWIASLTSGIPGSITGASRMWGDTAPVLVRPDLWDSKAGEVTWEEGALNGYFFGDRYIRGVDPQCYDLAGASPDGLHASGSLAALCAGSGGLRALYLRNPDGSQGDLVMRNARPGEVGNFAPNELTGPGRWSLDMAMSKSVEFMEGKKLEVRVDAQNIFNHPTPSNSAFRWNARFTQIGNPDFALNPGVNADNPYGFGLLSTKGGHRTFQAKIRLSF